MQPVFHLVVESDLDDQDFEYIASQLVGYNASHAGDENRHIIAVLLRDADNAIVGGLVGETNWGWFYIDVLWLPEQVRGQGYGRQLLIQAETRAREHGCQHAYLDTFSFQNVSFYHQNGYETYGELADFPPGQTRYYLKKTLRSTVPDSRMHWARGTSGR